MRDPRAGSRNARSRGVRRRRRVRSAAERLGHDRDRFGDAARPVYNAQRRPSARRRRDRGGGRKLRGRRARGVPRRERRAAGCPRRRRHRRYRRVDAGMRRAGARNRRRARRRRRAHRCRVHRRRRVVRVRRLAPRGVRGAEHGGVGRRGRARPGGVRRDAPEGRAHAVRGWRAVRARGGDAPRRDDLRRRAFVFRRFPKRKARRARLDVRSRVQKLATSFGCSRYPRRVRRVPRRGLLRGGRGGFALRRKRRARRGVPLPQTRRGDFGPAGGGLRGRRDRRARLGATHDRGDGVCVRREDDVRRRRLARVVRARAVRVAGVSGKLRRRRRRRRRAERRARAARRRRARVPLRVARGAVRSRRRARECPGTGRDDSPRLRRLRRRTQKRRRRRRARARRFGVRVRRRRARRRAPR
mmetsp:Transcript_580/g.2377  ORF Transcript_580/g.2377 Transcript_580/m.2377 type:complete len:415 (+) Transcript_580:619-1863(+)